MSITGAIEVPPACAVRDEMQYAVRGPFRLEDGFGDAARDTLGSYDKSIGIKFTDPEFAAVPRHVRVVPGEPCEARAVGADARVRVEVIARDEHSDTLAAIQ